MVREAVLGMQEGSLELSVKWGVGEMQGTGLDKWI